MLTEREYELLKQFSDSFQLPPEGREIEINHLVLIGLLETDDGTVSPYTRPGDPNILFRYRRTAYSAQAIKDYQDVLRDASLRKRMDIIWKAIPILISLAALVKSFFS